MCLPSCPLGQPYSAGIDTSAYKCELLPLLNYNFFVLFMKIFVIGVSVLIKGNECDTLECYISLYTLMICHFTFFFIHWWFVIWSTCQSPENLANVRCFHQGHTPSSTCKYYKQILAFNHILVCNPEALPGQQASLFMWQASPWLHWSVLWT